MSKNNSGLERSYGVAERKVGGPVVVNSFSKTVMVNGVPTENVPEVLKDPRCKEDSLTKVLTAFSELFEGVWKKK